MLFGAPIPRRVKKCLLPLHSLLYALPKRAKTAAPFPAPAPPTAGRAPPLALRAAVRVLAEKGAEARAAGALEVVEMHPEVGRVLDAALDGQRLMMRLRLARQKVRIQHARPQDRPPQLWLHDESQIVELRAASRLNVREVDEEGVDAHALWRPMGGLLVVVHLVELATAYGKQQGRR